MIRKLLFASLLTLTMLFQFTPANNTYAAEKDETLEYEDINDKNTFFPHQNDSHNNFYC